MRLIPENVKQTDGPTTFLCVKVDVKIHKSRKSLNISKFFEMFHNKILLKSIIKCFSLQLFFVVSKLFVVSELFVAVFCASVTTCEHYLIGSNSQYIGD